MDLKKLYDILGETTIQLRKGEMVHGSSNLVEAIKEGRDLDRAGGGVVTIDAMPHTDEAGPDIEKVDCEFLVIGVDRKKAEERRGDLIEILNSYPNPDRLAGGPSYIEVGAEIGDQGAAFQLFALGKALGLWEVITPKAFGFEGAEARQMAGQGFVMMSGYRKAA